MDRRRIELGEVTLEYVDTGGSGPAAVLLHGALMDETLWSGVVAELGDDVRCIVPILPMGGHRIAMPDGADTRPRAIAQLVGDLIRALEPQPVVLVGNDTGGALAQLLIADEPTLVDGLILVSCDAFDNFPPGLPGRTMAAMTAVPGAPQLAMTSLRIPALRRLPMTFGWMTKRAIDPAVFNRWVDAFTSNSAVRRDVRAMMRGVDRTQLGVAASRLSAFTGSSLVVWADDEKVMPPEHAPRLAEALNGAPVATVADSRTLIPLDQPGPLAELIRTHCLDLAHDGER